MFQNKFKNSCIFPYRAAGGGLYDCSPEDKKELDDQLARIDAQYGATGAEFLKFPSFSFTGEKWFSLKLEQYIFK